MARRLSTPHTRILRHASGRPWLVGRWSDDQITVAQAGSARIAVVGFCAVDPAELARRADRLREVTGLDAFAASLTGSFHLIAAADGRLRVQGSASNLRLVYYAEVDGVHVAADRADVLAALTGATLDQRQVAVRLLWPTPHPLLDTPLWHGLHGVPAGRYLLVENHGRTARLARWWAPPEPTRSLAEGAVLVREALTEAVRARTAAGATISCDLSGGLDSTSICFLAAAGEGKVLASTWPGLDPADDDLLWARRAAARLPGVDHLVWRAEESPLVYEGLLEIDDPLDEPTIGVMDRARALSHLPRLAAAGSRLHLTGIGGDHVTWCSEAYYHRLLRQAPVAAIRQLRGFRALFNWPLGPLLTTLADRRPYRRWLADAADGLRKPLPEPVVGALGWNGPPRLFPWITQHAANLVTEALRSAAESAEPLHADRGMHADLEQIQATARIVRQWEQMSGRVGLPIASPFFDDRVISACLSVRPLERVTPWRYKPLLVEAMRGVVPDECLARTSKAQAALDAARGLRENSAQLVAMWTESRLGELGLVDRDHLVRLTAQPDDPSLRHAILYSTIGCEVWLRGLETRGLSAAGVPERSSDDVATATP
ncbi:lasso peptide isopeptide bond-forming cyclase [Actinoplanes regularis]|uniref:asparagine synthase (glutamine-hydrolyzing) n=1 Tax=Actinoplanes regularis TaxID=52697 RepID=A0A239BN17_9ACTN|nr:lasso peptide isopeptide bond-forming cyclase [Actinoplanes regularis]SNS09009.1 asparagine synthase (glutamine-hydrolysing) [Actinoplanes regularis]